MFLANMLFIVLEMAAITVAVCKMPLYFYRSHAENIMGQGTDEQSLDAMEALEERVAFYREQGGRTPCRTHPGDALPPFKGHKELYRTAAGRAKSEMAGYDE